MGGKGIEQQQQVLHIAPGAAVGGELIDHGHHGGNGGVHLQGIDVLGDLLDGLVDDGLVGRGHLITLSGVLRQVPHTVQEPLGALDGIVGPGSGLLKVADEHDIKPHGVGAVLLHDVVGVHHIAPGLGHLLAALTQDHAVAGALGIGLLSGHHADVIEELVPEAGVEQVQRGVLHTTVVPVHGRPVVQRLLGGQGLVVVGVHIAQEVPGGTGPLGHGIRLTLGRAAALGAGGVDPVGHLGEGGLAGIGDLVRVHLRQQQGQLILRQRHPAALGAVHQRDGLAPVTLAAEDPVTEFEVGLGTANAVLRHPLLHGGDSLLDGQAVQEAGVDHDAGVVLEGEGLLGDVAALDHLDDGQAELGGKLPVALVVAGHAHDDAGAVAHEDVVGDKQGHLLAAGGVDGLNALQADAGLFLVQLTALKVGLVGRLVNIGCHGVPVFDLILPLLQIGMLRGDDHVGDAEEGIAAGGVNRQLVAVGGGEVHLGTFGPADPVLLLDLHTFNIVQIVQIVDETVGVLGDSQHPLALLLADDLTAAALAHAVHDLFVGQDDLAAGAPVDGHGRLVGQALLEHLQEDPLGPLVVVRIGGVDLPVPVEGVAQHMQLLAEVLNVVVGHLSRMDMVLDGVVLRGQAEGIIADGEEHIVTLHPLFAADDVHGGEGPGMAHVEALSGGIGELDEAVELLPGLITGDGSKGLLLQPLLLPFLLDAAEIVLHGVSPSFF